MSHEPSVIDQYQDHNSSLLRQFREWRIQRGDSHDQAEAHEFNLDFYLNHYLLHGSLHSAEAGASPELVRDFFGDFFVHKAMWTDVAEQKSSIESLLLFYCWLGTQNLVPQDSCGQLEVMIEAEKAQWFAAMEKCSEESLESWQSSDDPEMIDSGFFSEFDFAEETEVETMDADLEAFSVPGLDEDMDDPDDAMLLELVVTDEVENDPD